MTHELDVHWRISNFQLFANSLTYDEMELQSVSVPALGPHARALGDAHALMLACIHRLGHAQAPYYVDGIARYGANRLIWLYDIHLLGKTMSPGQWELFVQTAQEKALRSFCFDGLNAASRSFGASFPQTVLQSLSADGKGKDIPVSRLTVSRWEWLLSEFLALPDWRQRGILLKEHLFPSSSYMLKKYGVDDRRLLPLLYLHRAVKGVWRYGR